MCLLYYVELDHSGLADIFRLPRKEVQNRPSYPVKRAVPFAYLVILMPRLVDGASRSSRRHFARIRENRMVFSRQQRYDITGKRQTRSQSYYCTVCCSLPSMTLRRCLAAMWIRNRLAPLRSTPSKPQIHANAGKHRCA
jgi:hypothetical protein